MTLDFYTIDEDINSSQAGEETHYVDKVDPLDSKKLVESVNIAELLDEEELSKIASRVLDDLEVDKESMKDWLDQANTCMELTQIKREEKNYPWRKAPNIKHPMTAIAVVQFASRALPEMFKQGQVVDFKIIGRDGPKINQQGQIIMAPGHKKRRGQRVKMHLNYQVLEKMPDWLKERDKLHHSLAVVGTCFTKTWFDPVKGLNRSVWVPYTDIFVNNSITSLEEAPRISQYVSMSTNDIMENIRWGYFCDMNITSFAKDKEDSKAIYHAVVEQHTWLDLDGDGFPEPYIVTIHESAHKVLRIVARYGLNDIQYNDKKQIKCITAENYFSDYHFIPNPDGSFFSLGFGTLLHDLNMTSNTVLNQLLAAGHLATMQGGFLGKGIRIKSEDLSFQPGEWKHVPGTDGNAIKDNIVPLSYKEPSQVLFALLQLLLTSAKELTSTSEALLGTAEVQNSSPNSLQALIQQGLKVYTAIQRRIFTGFKKELEKLVRLNSVYVNPQEYINLVGPSPDELKEMLDPMTGKLIDYQLDSIEVVPVVDNVEATSTEQLGKAQAVMTSAPPFIQAGAANPREAYRFILEGMEIEQSIIDKIILPEPPPQPSPDMIKVQQDGQIAQAELQLQQQKQQIEGAVAQSKIKLHEAQAAKAIADGDANHGKVQLEVVRTALDHKLENTDDMIQIHKINSDLAAKAAGIQQKAQSDQADSTLKASAQEMKRPAPEKDPTMRNLPLPHVVHAEAVKRGWKPRELR